MPLKISLKPREKMIIGGAVIANGSSATDLYIENNVPILRQKDILSDQEANSPAKRIYFVIQLMYIDAANLPAHHQLYWQLVREFLEAAPSQLERFDRISEAILNNRCYQALKIAKELIEYENEVTRRV